MCLLYATKAFAFRSSADCLELVVHRGRGRLLKPHTSDINTFEAEWPALCY